MFEANEIFMMSRAEKYSREMETLRFKKVLEAHLSNRIKDEGGKKMPIGKTSYIEDIMSYYGYVKGGEEYDKYWKISTILPINTIHPKKVIFSGPATIIIWSDKTKTVVKCQDEEMDREKAIAMAIVKRALGNQGNYYNTVRKCLELAEEE